MKKLFVRQSAYVLIHSKIETFACSNYRVASDGLKASVFLLFEHTSITTCFLRSPPTLGTKVSGILLANLPTLPTIEFPNYSYQHNLSFLTNPYWVQNVNIHIYKYI